MSKETELAARGISLTVKLTAGAMLLAVVGLLAWYIVVRPGQEHKAAVQSGITAKAADVASRDRQGRGRHRRARPSRA